MITPLTQPTAQVIDQGASMYRGASVEAIQHHYDVSNDFYALWLDATRSYSCALWDGPHDTLDAAQERKLDYLTTAAHATRAAGAARVLDVGCGWGGLLRRLVERHGVGHVTGLTLSEAQATYVSGWAANRDDNRDADRYDVRVENWAAHRPTRTYDAIISIGAFEHFADMGLTRDGRVAAYREFFARCRDWLPPGGRLAVQTNVKGNNTRMNRQTVQDLLFIIDRIFPESELPWPSEILEASERLVDVVSVRNDPDDYARTCQEWLDRLRAHRARAEELINTDTGTDTGPDTVADYERYLAAAVDAFRRRHLGLQRVIFEKV